MLVMGVAVRGLLGVTSNNHSPDRIAFTVQTHATLSGELMAYACV